MKSLFRWQRLLLHYFPPRAEGRSFNHSPAQGFALPMAVALGLCMFALGLTTILLAQDERDSAALRRDGSASMLSTDSAIAQILTAFSLQRNAILLGKNYDPINPKTGKTFLGADGIPNSGDEGTTAVDEWQSLSPSCLPAIGLDTANLALNESLGAQSSYTVLAYRYDANTQLGNLLVEGSHNGLSSQVHINLAIAHNPAGFPGVLVDESSYWQGRNIAGSHGNLYFDPNDSPNGSLSSKASPSDLDRDSYLNAIWSGSLDGFASDPIAGNVVACAVNFTLPYGAQGTDLGIVNSSQSLSGSTAGITHYQADQIELSGTDELTVDTADGPVYLYVNGTTSLRNSAKIRNIRSDGSQPQVGDLRIIQTQPEGAPVVLYDTTCIEQAFVYSPLVDVHLLTSGDGCPGDSDSNIIGVLWAEDIENSPNSATAQFYDRGAAPTLDTNGVTSGIEIPEQLSSLVDALDSVNLPVLYRISGINTWTKVRL